MNKIQRGADDPRRRPQPEEGPLSILYEDDAVIVVDKPAGEVVHPTYKNTSGTLLNAILWRYRERPAVQPGILTRLDKNTSGIVIVALSPELHATMQRDMIAGRVRKEYLAIVSGVPEPRSGRITFRLGRSAEDRRLVVVRDDGAPCVTDYDVLATETGGEHSSLVRCELQTGRTHQIRVHLAASGWPVLGDATYARPSGRIARQALHAWRVTFPHPISRDALTLTSPIPADMAWVVESTGARLP